MIKNLYIMVANGKNMLKMIGVRIAVFEIENTTAMDYTAYHAALQQDPFSASFQNSIYDSYTSINNTVNDKSLSLSSQISRIYTILKNLLDLQQVDKKL